MFGMVEFTKNKQTLPLINKTLSKIKISKKNILWLKVLF